MSRPIGWLSPSLPLRESRQQTGFISSFKIAIRSGFATGLVSKARLAGQKIMTVIPWSFLRIWVNR